MNLESKVVTALKMLRHPSKLLLPAGRNGLLNFVPDKLYLKAIFKVETGYKLNLQNPQTYNEKLQWIKLYDRKQAYTMYADKYAVREYIGQLIGKKYLVPLIGVYNNAEEIDWSALPDRFVLKCTHASGANIICKDKAKLNTTNAEKQLNGWLQHNAFWGGREWCYKNIKPRIICEEFIETLDGNTPDDYKFMCFNGEPKLIQFHHDRFGAHTLDYYTPSWNRADIKRIDEDTSLKNVIQSRPVCLDEMLNLSRILSKDMYYARIDFYSENSQVYFGEITLYPTGGFSTFSEHDVDLELGSWIKLPTS